MYSICLEIDIFRHLIIVMCLNKRCSSSRFDVFNMKMIISLGSIKKKKVTVSI